MINVSGYTTDEIIEKFTQSYRDVKCKAKLADGRTLTNREIISCSIQEQIISQDKFVFGTQNSSAMDMEISNLNEEYTPNYFIGQEIQVWFCSGDIEVPMGIFVIDEAKKNSGKIKITCYDRVILTSQNYDKKTELTYPATLKQIAQDACSISRVMFQTEKFFNSDLLLEDMVVFSTDIECRQILANIAELACGYVVASRDGIIKIKELNSTQVAINLTPKNYRTFEILDQMFGPIKSVYMVYGDGENAKDKLFGEGSPQFQVRNNHFTPKDFDYLPEKLYNNIKGIQYTPATLEYQGVPIIECGDFINVTDKKGTTYKILVTGQKFEYDGGLKCTVTSAGKSDMGLATEQKEIISESVEGLHRRQNTLQQIIDKAKLETVMKQVDEFSGRIDGLIKDMKEVQMKVTPDGIVNTVTNSKSYQDTIDGIYDGMNGLAGQTVKAESIIAQHADSINMSVKEGNVISAINLDKSGVKIQGDKINLKGVVTFESLANEGETVINGGNITTGTFSGDRIYGGTIEAVDIKGDNVDVMANLSVSPAADPTYAGTNGLYQNPQNPDEWANIDFKIYNKQVDQDRREISSVKLGVFPYKEDIFGSNELDPQNPHLWKYGLELNGAIRVQDDIYIKGQNGLVVDHNLQVNEIKTNTITGLSRSDSQFPQGLQFKLFDSLYPMGTINSSQVSQPYIWIEQGVSSNEDERRPQLCLQSEKSVTIKSMNPTKYPSLVVDTIQIKNPTQTFSGQPAKSVLIGDDFELLKPDFESHASLYASDLFVKCENDFLPAIISNEKSKIISKEDITGNEPIIINNQTYYYKNLIINEVYTSLNVIVSSNTIGGNVWWDKKENRIVSNSANVEFSCIIYLNRG